MSNYNVGQIIKLTREAIGLSQEELADGVCSVQTLSRIENGKVKVKKKTYQQLMEKMGRDGTKNYSVLSTENFELLDIMVEVNNLIFRHEYEEAEKKHSILKEKLDLDNCLNYQYIERHEVNILDGIEKISKMEALERLENLISKTIPDYKQFLNKTYPFMHKEVLLLMNIGNVYGDLKEWDKALQIFYMLIRSLNTGYMRYSDSIQIIVMLVGDIARIYGGRGERDKAIRMCWNAICRAKKNCLYSILPKCYGEIAWNMMKQIEKGERTETDKELCKQYLRQGYAVAVLSKQNLYAEITRNVYEFFFVEKIYCSLLPINGDVSPSSANNSTCES